jgi:5'-nucleotidase
MTQDPIVERILITNDDGIDAPGLAVAIDVASELATEVWVSAPATDCSGTSRQISLHSPLRILRRGERTIAVTGSPADSAVVGLRHLMRDTPPDLVISGVNAGSNHSKELGYSGTVGAALTARMMGVRAVALSQAWISRGQLPWDTSRVWLPRVIRRALEHELSWPDETILNVNVPNVAADEVSGIEITRLASSSKINIELDHRVDHREQDYFWLKMAREHHHSDSDTDADALGRNAISVTPIGFDQTDHALREQLHSQALFTDV